MIYRGLLAGVLLQVLSCHQPLPKKIRPAFYYWKQTFRLDSLEQGLLGEEENPVLYLHFFDVTRDRRTGQPAPVAALVIKDSVPDSLEYIPVVYITNETLAQSPAGQMGLLATHILEKIRRLSMGIGHGYRAVQIDCDWTVATRDRYFMLLRAIRQSLHSSGKQLSVTLRLHQIKYPEKTGVPPADRGMLMFYNMGDWKQPQTRNSLYDLRTADKYLSRLGDYPLALDVVLPILRWTIVYRNGKFLTFLNYIAGDDLGQQTFLHPTEDENRFRVKTDTFAFGCGLRKGDLLRSETCRFEDLMEGKKQLLRRIHNPGLTLAIFHLDSLLLTHYTHAQIQKILSAVQ